MQHGISAASKVEPVKSATQETWNMTECNMNKAQREKMQHEKLTRVKYGKRVHKNSKLECTNR